MTGKTHQIAGITLGLGYLLFQAEPAYQPATLALVLVGSSLAALLPDIDQPASAIWEKIPVVGHIAGHVTREVTFGHRNLTHSLLGVFLIGLLLRWLLLMFPSSWGINIDIVFMSMMLSYGVHLLADTFTVQGVPWLWPWQRNFGLPPKPFQGIRIETSHWFENIVLFPILNVILIILIVTNWHTLVTILIK